MNKYIGSMVLFLASCSATDSQTGTTEFEKNSCVLANSTYLAQYSETSGNCGPLTDQVLNVPADGQIRINGNCNKSPKYDGCTVIMDAECSFNENGINFVLTQTGKVEWMSDGSSGSGLVSIQVYIPNTGETCQSVYSLYIEKI